MSEEEIIRPSKEELIVKGKLAYSESLGAWNTIRLKKEILNEYKVLKEKQKIFSYKLVFYQNSTQLEKAMKQVKRDNLPTPMLLWFVKERKEQV